MFLFFLFIHVSILTCLQQSDVVSGHPTVGFHDGPNTGYKGRGVSPQDRNEANTPIIAFHAYDQFGRDASNNPVRLGQPVQLEIILAADDRTGYDATRVEECGASDKLRRTFSLLRNGCDHLTDFLHPGNTFQTDPTDAKIVRTGPVETFLLENSSSLNFHCKVKVCKDVQDCYDVRCDADGNLKDHGNHSQGWENSTTVTVETGSIMVHRPVSGVEGKMVLRLKRPTLRLTTPIRTKLLRRKDRWISKDAGSHVHGNICQGTRCLSDEGSRIIVWIECVATIIAVVAMVVISGQYFLYPMDIKLTARQKLGNRKIDL